MKSIEVFIALKPTGTLPGQKTGYFLTFKVLKDILELGQEILSTLRTKYQDPFLSKLWSTTSLHMMYSGRSDNKTHPIS